MKTCNKCKVKKQVTEFSKHPQTKDGLQTVCKQCVVERNRASYRTRYETNKEGWNKWIKKSQNKNGSGVYEIHENETSLYIGSAVAINRRIWNHKSYIKNPKSAQKSVAYLYPLLQQHQCEFKILEVCDDYLEKEKQYINQLKPKYNTYGI
jgi:hypothetical protein